LSVYFWFLFFASLAPPGDKDLGVEPPTADFLASKVAERFQNSAEWRFTVDVIEVDAEGKATTTMRAKVEDDRATASHHLTLYEPGGGLLYELLVCLRADGPAAIFEFNHRPDKECSYEVSARDYDYDSGNWDIHCGPDDYNLCHVGYFLRSALVGKGPFPTNLVSRLRKGEVLGLSDVDGKRCWAVATTLDNGVAERVYIDSDEFVVRRLDRVIPGKEGIDRRLYYDDKHMAGFAEGALSAHRCGA